MDEQGTKLVGARLRLALEMADAGREMMRLHLRRKHPAATADELTALMNVWIRHRPGAKFGDAEGRGEVVLDSLT